ncbi:MAG: class I SAM-dependent methyltransferase [Legionella sp.]|uniref:class I SAM-dependent methyltransferase n=1 Tax=Legionella sp. TaxID=459 RepID=UPI0039E6F87C
MMDISIVGYEHESLRDKAQSLAESLHFTLDKEANPCLFVTTKRLTLKIPHFSLLYPELEAASWNKRKQEGKKQGLVRACKPSSGLKIIDTTAGWGRDAAVLASCGAEVLMIERHPVMAALLTDALRHSTEQQQKLPLSLHQGSAYAFLDALRPEDYPDVIYIDPMHPERSKSALVKKEMQALQQMIGADEDALDLIGMAVKRVKQRVVVKWPQNKKPLLAADAFIVGKTIRFDIYFARFCENFYRIHMWAPAKCKNPEKA